jgi:hypothetical protein
MPPSILVNRNFLCVRSGPRPVTISLGSGSSAQAHILDPIVIGPMTPWRRQWTLEPRRGGRRIGPAIIRRHVI